ncbi:MAG: hypothetical protein AMJ73_04050 [candidate division Zixibacteria bacterium SM1_73]|nr:MAG: hypothetical protein AMJ73_04050 [candidate division Zixibacteria bacterium SM1_73]
MNHRIDADPQAPNSEDEKILDSEFSASTSLSTLSLSKGRSQEPKDLKLIEILIDKSIKTLEENSCKPRIQDALKAIQLKQKVAKTSEAEKIFWDEIEAIRREELPKLYPEPMDPDGLEAQLLTTITGLKHLLKNGILPLKIIADTFNEGRSKETRLSYHRIARLLSKIGFRKVKTHGGCSAILWDDKLLSRNTFSDADNSCPLDG